MVTSLLLLKLYQTTLIIHKYLFIYILLFVLRIHKFDMLQNWPRFKKKLHRSQINVFMYIRIQLIVSFKINCTVHDLVLSKVHTNSSHKTHRQNVTVQRCRASKYVVKATTFPITHYFNKNVIM